MILTRHPFLHRAMLIKSDCTVSIKLLTFIILNRTPQTSVPWPLLNVAQKDLVTTSPPIQLTQCNHSNHGTLYKKILRIRNSIGQMSEEKFRD